MNSSGATLLDREQLVCSPQLWTPADVQDLDRQGLLNQAIDDCLDNGWPLEKLFDYQMSRQYFSELVAWAVADGTAVANSTTETIIYPNVTFPANIMNDGRRWRARLFGKFSTTTGPPTLTFRVRWGGVAGTLLAASPAITTVASITNAIFMLDIMLQTRTNGATGTMLAWLEAALGAAAAPTVGSATGSQGEAFGGSGGQTSPAATTVDLTADTALSITAQWSAASASNTLTGMDYALENMN